MTKPQPQPPTHARALKTFQSRYGLVRKGMVFQPAPGYGKQLERNKLIVWITDEEAARVKAATPSQQPAGPGEKREDKSIPGAPARKDRPGKGLDPDKTAPGSTPSDSDSAATPDAGKEPSLSASDQARASHAKTLTTSTAGAVTTPPKKNSPRRKVVVGKDRSDA